MSAPSPAARRLGAPVRLVLLSLLWVYGRTLSGILGGQCRFYPSCSRYAQEAVRTHGALRGSWLALRRLARCGPNGRGGVDHVPPARKYDDVIRAAPA